jgi:hypothetical protein
MLHHRICAANLAGHKNLQVTLAILWLSVVCALGQTQTTTYAFGFRIYNATCTPQTVTWHAFIAVSGNGYNVGNATLTIAAGVTTPVIVSGVIQSGVFEGYTVIVDGATQLNQDVWSYGQPCQSGVTPPITNTIGTNIVFKTVYVPVYARVRVPGGPDTNALVRVYKKTVAVFP